MSPVHTHLSHRHDPLCSLTLDVLFLLCPFTNSGLFIFPHTLIFPFLRAVYILPPPPVSVSNNYILALFIQETVGARTQFFRRSHIASFPPPSLLSAAACTLHYAYMYRWGGGFVYSVSFGLLLLLLSFCCIVCLLLSFPESKKDSKETRKKRTNKQAKQTKQHEKVEAHVLYLRITCLCQTVIPFGLISDYENFMHTCCHRLHEDAGTNFLRNLLIIYETP